MIENWEDCAPNESCIALPPTVAVLANAPAAAPQARSPVQPGPPAHRAARGSIAAPHLAPARGNQQPNQRRISHDLRVQSPYSTTHGPTGRALAPLRASEGWRTCRVSGPRRGGSSRGGQWGAPGRTAPRSPRSAPSQPGALPEHVSRPWLDVGRYWRPDAVRRGPTPTRPRRARCADPVRPSRPLASACRSRQPP